MSQKLNEDGRKSGNSKTKPAVDPRPLTFDVSFACLFGLFLGLCIWKFGNPVILDQKISTPVSPSEWLNDAWPTHWANGIFLLLAAIGAVFMSKKKVSWPTPWLWLLPLMWFGWQIISAVATGTFGSNL